MSPATHRARPSRRITTPSRSRRVVAVAAPLGVAAAVFAGQTGIASGVQDWLFGSSSTSAELTASLQRHASPQPSGSAPATSPGRAPRRQIRTLVLAQGKSYGPIDGRVVLRAGLRARGAVVFTLTGPATVKLPDRRAPYAVMLDAGRLTAGTYTVKVSPAKGEGQGLTATLVVAHRGAPAQPDPSPTASVPASPTAPPATSPPKPTATTSQPAPTTTTTKPAPSTTKPAPTTTKPTTTKPAPPAAQPPSSDGVTEVARLTNVQRTANGCKALTIDSRLNKAAQLHSEDMVARRFFEHANPDGVRAGARISAQGYTWRSWGENIAYGQESPAEVVTTWMNSPAHRENILDCGFTQIGIGIATTSSGTIYWTQNFATPG